MDDDDAFLYGDSADVKEEAQPTQSHEVKDGEHKLFSCSDNSF